jgi:hypothetical protein
LAVNKSFFSGNWVLGGRFLGFDLNGEPGGNALGGSLCILGGTAALTNSTLASNYIVGGAALSGFNNPGSGFGGAVYNAATMRLLNCTVAGNVARAGSNSTGGGSSTGRQGGAYGGGLCNSGGSMTLDQVTLANNAAVPSGPIDPFFPAAIITLGGNLFGTNGSTSLRSSIVANSLSGSNSFGVLTDLGHNLSSDASANFTGPGSLNSADPKLGPLDNYGGHTPTMALLTGSPAIDTGDNVTFPPADQRGRARPYGSAADIGAFESSPPYVIRGAVAGNTLNEEVGVVTSTTNVMTFNRGNFSLEGLAAGAYSVVPASSNFVFYPTNRLVSVGPDQLGVNFKAYHWNMLSLESATNGVLRLVFAGTNGLQYQMLASSNLANWFPVSTNTTGTSNLFEFVDSTPSSNRTRFYQTVSP